MKIEALHWNSPMRSAESDFKRFAYVAEDGSPLSAIYDGGRWAHAAIWELHDGSWHWDWLDHNGRTRKTIRDLSVLEIACLLASLTQEGNTHEPS